MTPEQKKQLEADYTYLRIYELQIKPVQGAFDVSHLKEVNRRILQDLPALGFDHINPGQFRDSVPLGGDWIKDRKSSIIRGSFFVVHSRMDDDTMDALTTILDHSTPDKLRHLPKDSFVDAFTKLYIQLEYIHPFLNANSRTLRAFTKQLANESGYDVLWGQLADNSYKGELLRNSRDLSVNRLAKPHIHDRGTLLTIMLFCERLEGSKEISDIFHDIIVPLETE